MLRELGSPPAGPPSFEREALQARDWGQPTATLWAAVTAAVEAHEAARAAAPPPAAPPCGLEALRLAEPALMSGCWFTGCGLCRACLPLWLPLKFSLFDCLARSQCWDCCGGSRVGAAVRAAGAQTSRACRRPI